MAPAQWPEAWLRFPATETGGTLFPEQRALLESASGNLHIHESQLFRQLWDKLEKGDVLLADRGFCSYAALLGLQQRGVDSVMRLHQKRPADFRAGRALGPDDRLIVWPKHAKRPEAWSVEEFAVLPATLTLRMIRLRVAVPGFRTREVVLVTTLLDAQAYRADALRDLYGERWHVELHFHQIKVSLAMDVLRCQSPEMI